ELRRLRDELTRGPIVGRQQDLRLSVAHVISPGKTARSVRGKRTTPTDRNETCAIMRWAQSPRRGGVGWRKMLRIVSRAAWRRLVLCVLVVLAASVPVAAQSPVNLRVTHTVDKTGPTAAELSGRV